MTFITDWISQIVFFIFLATFISLLIPSTKHDKVIKLVFGLVIFLLFLHPLTELFNINPNQYVDQWEVAMEDMLGDEIESEINSKKIEIQESQHAYILEQLKIEIRNLVEEDLLEQHNATLNSIDITMKEEDEKESYSAEDIKNLTFYLEKEMDNQIQDIEIVSIPSRKNESDKTEKTSQIVKMLANKLNISEDQIQLIWEGDKE
jgi:stage III sporulation protein AF